MGLFVLHLTRWGLLITNRSCYLLQFEQCYIFRVASHISTLLTTNVFCFRKRLSRNLLRLHTIQRKKVSYEYYVSLLQPSTYSFTAKFLDLDLIIVWLKFNSMDPSK